MQMHIVDFVLRAGYQPMDMIHIVVYHVHYTTPWKLEMKQSGPFLIYAFSDTMN